MCRHRSLMHNSSIPGLPTYLIDHLRTSRYRLIIAVQLCTGRHRRQQLAPPCWRYTSLSVVIVTDRPSLTVADCWRYQSPLPVSGTNYQWRRLNGARDGRAHVETDQETDQTVLTIMKALTKTTNCTCRAKKSGAARQQLFTVLRAGHVPLHFQIRSGSNALPVKSEPSLRGSCRRLKTHLFNISFSRLSVVPVKRLVTLSGHYSHELLTTAYLLTVLQQCAVKKLTGKRHKSKGVTYTAPHAEPQLQRRCRPQTERAPKDFDLRQTAIRSPGLPFNGLHPRNPCNYIGYLPTLTGWTAELVSLVDP